MGGVEEGFKRDSESLREREKRKEKKKKTPSEIALIRRRKAMLFRLCRLWDTRKRREEEQTMTRDF